MIPVFLIGNGQDSHRLGAAKTDDEVLVLAGVPFSCGLQVIGANSDADVILHALYNAISSSLGGGSLGPVADEMCAGGITDSAEYLRVVLAKMTRRGYRINNLTIALEAGQPRLEKYFSYMRGNLARLCNLDPEQIGLTVTSGENLTSFGKGQGISCWATVLLVREDPG